MQSSFEPGYKDVLQPPPPPSKDGFVSGTLGVMTILVWGLGIPMTKAGSCTFSPAMMFCGRSIGCSDTCCDSLCLQPEYLSELSAAVCSVQGQGFLRLTRRHPSCNPVAGAPFFCVPGFVK